MKGAHPLGAAVDLTHGLATRVSSATFTGSPQSAPRRFTLAKANKEEGRVPTEDVFTGREIRASRLVASFQRQNERLGVSPSCSASSFTPMGMSGMLFLIFSLASVTSLHNCRKLPEASGRNGRNRQLTLWKVNNECCPFHPRLNRRWGIAW